MATIVKFYKVKNKDYKNPKLLATKNLDYIPVNGSYIEHSNQMYRVVNVLFNLDTCEYAVAMARV